MFQTQIATFLWLALAVAHCGGSEFRTQNPFVHPQPVSQDALAETVITLLRTSCRRGCPVYKLTIFGDGKVLFDGSKHVRKKGKAEGFISQENLEELIIEFQNIYFFNLNDAYTTKSKHCRQSVRHMSSAMTSLTLGGRHKRINHYHGCRGSDVFARLSSLEAKIDEAVNVDQWIK